jgi:signal transduction histidine kinase
MALAVRLRAGAALIVELPNFSALRIANNRDRVPHVKIPAARFLLSRRVVLWAGFSALLVLMLVLAIRADSALRDIEQRNDRIRRDFLSRDDLLNQLRTNLYQSGIDIRDYLLEADESRAEERGQELLAVRKQMLAALERYNRDVPAEESADFSQLRKGVEDYWALLYPVIGWNLAFRLGAGDTFLREQVFPRHEQLLALADQIATVNEHQLALGDKQVAALFAEFRSQISGTALMTIVVGLGIAAISVGRILSLERISELQHREVARARSELQQFSARLVAMQEEERRRLSRELHDEVGQSMSALLVELSNVEAKIREAGGSADASLASVRRLAENSVGVIRNMALLLRPSMLDDLGLVPALRWQARELSRRTTMRVKVAADDVPDDLPDQHRTCVYRVIQEALHNAAKHAHAQSARVTVKQENHEIRVIVQDDGAGFDPGQDKGMGMIGMEERVRALGGVFRVESEPGKGTTVSAVLPLAPRPNVAEV